MKSIYKKSDSSQAAAEMAVYLFDDWLGAFERQDDPAITPT
jgi:hypothetical protein